MAQVEEILSAAGQATAGKYFFGPGPGSGEAELSIYGDHSGFSVVVQHAPAARASDDTPDWSANSITEEGPFEANGRHWIRVPASGWFRAYVDNIGTGTTGLKIVFTQ